MITQNQQTDSRLKEAGEEIKITILGQGGLRIGEASAVSTRVHTVDVGTPGEIVALPSDAGQVFYQRNNRGEILHVDCFHELGKVEHKKLASFLIQYLRKIQTEFNFPDWIEDYIDIQTAEGGGRLTGSLEYGKKKTLRDAHLSHVHLAMYITPESCSLILPLIHGLEKGIIKQGLKLKKIEKLIVKPLSEERGKDSNKEDVDLSDYSTEADSLLKEKDPEKNSNKTGNSSKDYMENDEEDKEDKDDLHMKDQFEENYQEREKYGDDLEREGFYDKKQRSRNLQDLAQLRSECGDDPKKVSEFIEKLEKGYPLDKLSKNYPRTYDELGKLKKKKILKEKDAKVFLTSYGKNLLNYLKEHLKEIEKSLKRLARKLPETKGKLPKKVKGNMNSFSKNYFGKGQVISREDTEYDGPLAVPETVVKSAVRSYNDRKALQIKAEDIQVIKPRKFTTLNLCLLIDASGSMAGRRMKEVKILAEHLLLSTRDKVAIVAFQEDRVEIVVPFTRDRYEMKNGLMKLKAAGLTPMSYGLKEGKKYVEEKGGKNSMLLLITDGLPTICGGSADPFAETLVAASEIAQSKSKFTCIGLKPNVSFLKKLSEKAGGSLYIVDELRKESLLRVINQERQGF